MGLQFITKAINLSLYLDKISDLDNMPDAFSDKRYLSNSAVPKLYNELIPIDWSFITDYTNINDDFNKFLDCFMNKYYLLSKPYRSHNVKIKQPWMTNALCTSCAVTHRTYKTMLNGKYSPDSYKMYCNKLTTIIRTAKAAYFNNYINNHRLNARAIWNMINTYIYHSNHTSSNKHFCMLII